MSKKVVKKTKKKISKMDGLGPYEIKRIRQALRKVWHQSHARALVVKRCIGRGGFSYCEACGKRSPKVYIDHTIACGDVDGGFIERLFTPSKNLTGMCKKCHDAKTKEERALKKMLGTP